MSQFANLPVVLAVGVGASVDTGAMASDKTIIVAGVFVGNLVVEASSDGVEWAPVATFSAASPAKKTSIAACFMRVRTVAYTSGAPTVDVASAQDDVRSLVLVSPAGTGSGPSSDSSLLVQTRTVYVGGVFTGSVTVEGSNDDASWSPLATVAGGDSETISAISRFMRVTRENVDAANPGLPVVGVCATGDVGFADNVGTDLGPPTPDTRTIFARPAGSDDTGDGRSAATAYATFVRAIQDVPMVVPLNVRYIVDITGINEVLPAGFTMPEFLAVQGLVFDLAGGALDYFPLPVTVRAEPTVIDTITAGEITGSVQDPLSEIRTLNTTKNYLLDEQRTRLLLGSGLADAAVVGSNTAGPNSSIEYAHTTEFTAPIRIAEPGAVLTGSPDLLVHYTNANIAFIGVELSSVRTDMLANILNLFGCWLTDIFCDGGGARVGNLAVVATLVRGDVEFRGTQALMFNNLFDGANLVINGLVMPTITWGQNIYDGCNALGRVFTTTRRVNQLITLTLEQSIFRNGSQEAIFVAPGTLMDLSKLNVHDNVGAGVVCEGRVFIREAGSSGGLANGGLGLEIRDGGYAEVEAAVDIRGAGGDYKVGANAASAAGGAAWAAFHGAAPTGDTDVAAGVASQLCRLFED